MTRASDAADTQDDRGEVAAVAGAFRRAGGDTFAVAFLPREKRRAVAAVGAFAGLVRDAVAGDPTAPPGPGCAAHATDDVAARVRSRIEQAYHGTLGLPPSEFRDESQHVLAAFARAVGRYQIPEPLFRPMLDGFCHDVSIVRYATWASLERQCAATGGTVARAVVGVFGPTHSDAGAFAERAGVAAGLTAMLTSLASDAARGRVNLPLEDLARLRYSERELLAGTVNDRLRELVRFEAARARGLLDEASAAVPWLAGDGSRMAAAAYLANQLATLDQIERAADPFRVAIRLSLARRVRQLPAAWRMAKGSPSRSPNCRA
jgi:phytoene/squalene synthetase